MNPEYTQTKEERERVVARNDGEVECGRRRREGRDGATLGSRHQKQNRLKICVLVFNW